MNSFLLPCLVAAFCLPPTHGSLREGSVLRSVLDLQTVSEQDVSTNHWAVEVTGGEAKAKELADKYSLEYLGPIGNLENHFHFRRLQPDSDASHRSIHPAFPEEGQGLTELLRLEENVGYVQQQSARAMSKKVYHAPTDPKWPDQWSLLNTGQTDGRVGRDLNVVPVWREGITGSGVVVTIVDEGVEINHPDLSGNYDSRASHDYIHYDSNPTPEPAGFNEEPNDHGTACAGIVAMTKDNGRCGSGVAYDCNLGGVKMNLSSGSDAIEASALGYQNSYIDVYSNSWGPSDFLGIFVSKPGPLATNTLRGGATNGRGGKGSIYVFASGNGGNYDDSCAADGYTSSVYTIGIGSADQHGAQADYDESCSGKMAVTFSYNSHGFPTRATDTFDPHDQVIATAHNGGCRDDFTGTSSSAPLLSGVMALVLQANPSLTWRDVQYLIAYTSNSTSLYTGDWVTNGRGLKVSHKFGFGAIDAAAMVTRARTWTNVPTQLTQTVRGSSSYGSARYSRYFSSTFTVSSSSDISYLEHVVVTMTLNVRGYTSEYGLAELFDAASDASDDAAILRWLEEPHPRRGDIKVDLTSPSGTVSNLLPYRQYDFRNDEGYDNWPFMSVHHWGENPIGRWTLTVTFKSSTGYVYVDGVSMKLYGVATDPGAISTHPVTTAPTTHSHTQPTTTSTPHSHTTSTPHSHTTSTTSSHTSPKTSTPDTHSTNSTPHTPSKNSSSVPPQPGSTNAQSDTVKYVLAGVFSVGGLLLLVIVGVAVGVTIYYLRRRKLGVRFRRLQSVVDDSKNPNSISM